MSFYGLLNLPWWGYVVVTLVMAHISLLGISLYLHRSQAHRAVDLHPAVSHFFRFWLWLTSGMKTKEWVAVHRKHHARCETEEDPHSPQVLGLKKVLWQGTELYRQEKKISETLDKFGKGTPNDWLEKYVYSAKFMRGKQGVTLLLIAELILLGGPGLIVWGLQMALAPFLAAGIINGVGHYIGYRNFEPKDASRNMIPFGIFIAGEELHNNHHAYGNAAKFSIKWWEVDIGWGYIRLLSALKLAQVKHLPPKVAIEHNKNTIDMETVQAVIHNRMELLSNYTKKVMLPAFRTAYKERMVSLQAKKLLVRHYELLDEQEKQTLEAMLQKSPALNYLYERRLALEAIWNKTSASNKELLEALQAWCQQAEQARIEGLATFSRYLKSYQLKTVSS